MNKKYLHYSILAVLLCVFVTGCNIPYVYSPDNKSIRHESSSSKSSKSKSDSDDGVIIIDDDDEEFSEPYYPYETDPTGDTNPNGFYSHNIYCYPDTGNMGNVEAFSIDFMIPEESDDTYWAMCLFSMDNSMLSDVTKMDPRDVGNSGSGYGGIQNTNAGKVFIGSIWDTEYFNENGNTIIRNAKLIDHAPGTPIGGERFGNEGEGARCRLRYDWKKNKWYRFVVRSYAVKTDNGNTTTIVDQWLQDKDTKEWFLIARYDTGLDDSSLCGDFSQFIENFNADTYYQVRSIYWKNIYLKSKDSNSWKPIEGATLKVLGTTDDGEKGKPNKKGGFNFGSNGEYFWAITCGVGENILLSNPDVKREGHYIIKNSDSAPNLDELSMYEAVKEPVYTINIEWDSNLIPYPQYISLNMDLSTSYNEGDTLDPYEDNSFYFYSDVDGHLLAKICEPNTRKGETFDYMKILIYDATNVGYNITWDTGLENSNVLGDCEITIYKGDKKIKHLTQGDCAVRAYTGVWYLDICRIENGNIQTGPSY